MGPCVGGQSTKDSEPRKSQVRVLVKSRGKALEKRSPDRRFQQEEGGACQGVGKRTGLRRQRRISPRTVSFSFFFLHSRLWYSRREIICLAE